MKQTRMFFALAAILLLAAACNKAPVINQDTLGMQTPEQPSMKQNADGGMENPETAAAEKAVGTMNAQTHTTSGEAQTHGNYLPYSAETVKAEQAAGHRVVLFFHADWCPFCVEADKQFRANIDKIPSGVTVLKTNYDLESALKQKYVVTYQHTFVQIDASGKLVSKWNSGDIDNLKKNLK